MNRTGASNIKSNRLGTLCMRPNTSSIMWWRSHHRNRVEMWLNDNLTAAAANAVNYEHIWMPKICWTFSRACRFISPVHRIGPIFSVVCTRTHKVHSHKSTRRQRFAIHTHTLTRYRMTPRKLCIHRDTHTHTRYRHYCALCVRTYANRDAMRGDGAFITYNWDAIRDIAMLMFFGWWCGV